MDIKTVTKIAKLARIALKDEEKQQMATELDNIMKWIDQLQKVDTSGVPQMHSHSGITLPWRDDVVTDGDIQGEIVANSPSSEYGCFAVPKVIE
jgi:aspartyl-tRNA(Asn)/glutamyl-tRNA(Gln) amidotransferase subunit C